MHALNIIKFPGKSFAIQKIYKIVHIHTISHGIKLVIQCGYLRLSKKISTGKSGTNVRKLHNSGGSITLESFNSLAAEVIFPGAKSIASNEDPGNL